MLLHSNRCLVHKYMCHMYVVEPEFARIPHIDTYPDFVIFWTLVSKKIYFFNIFVSILFSVLQPYILFFSFSKCFCFTSYNSCGTLELFLFFKRR